MASAYFTRATELVERLRDEVERAYSGEDLCAEAAEVIELLLDRINHLTNVNDGLHETLEGQRKGLMELRAMIAAEQSA